jgi:MinD superfamily P-loop ATPase
MIISIASGKGGTGKTTVAVNLAAAIDSDIQLLDCDVEEPNAHLFIRPDITETESVAAMVPEVDKAACTGCGKCGEICQFKAIVVINKAVLTFPELCHSCGGCMEVCAEKAVKEASRELGIIERGRRDHIEFIHGKLRVGEAMSPPLIRKVRACARPEAFTIIDAPPGTSCPVIAAMKDTDFVLLVTEPTPFGLNDLILAVEAVKMLRIPCGILLNRSDLGNKSVQQYAKTEKIPLLMEIPFDRRIAEAYSKGIMLVTAFPEWREKFAALFQQILTIIKSAGPKL